MSENTVPLSRGRQCTESRANLQNQGVSGSRRARAGVGGAVRGWGETAGRRSLREGKTRCCSRLWRLLQKDWGEWAGAGAKGPERQMSPISVLPWLA